MDGTGISQRRHLHQSVWCLVSTLQRYEYCGMMRILCWLLCLADSVIYSGVSRYECLPIWANQVMSTKYSENSPQYSSICSRYKRHCGSATCSLLLHPALSARYSLIAEVFLCSFALVGGFFVVYHDCFKSFITGHLVESKIVWFLVERWQTLFHDTSYVLDWIKFWNPRHHCIGEKTMHFHTSLAFYHFINLQIVFYNSRGLGTRTSNSTVPHWPLVSIRHVRVRARTHTHTLMNMQGCM